MNQRQRRRIANYCAAMLISMAMDQGWGLSQDDIDSLGLSEEEVQRIEDEVCNIRQELLNRVGMGDVRESKSSDARDEAPSGAHPDVSPERGAAEFGSGDVVGKKYAVCPGYVRSENDGDRHYIGFSALVRLYGVDPTECLLVSPQAQDSTLPPYVEELIWLYPQRHSRQYDEMREELARGDDTFKVEQ